jgi:hypothetical protein
MIAVRIACTEDAPFSEARVVVEARTINEAKAFVNLKLVDLEQEKTSACFLSA